MGERERKAPVEAPEVEAPEERKRSGRVTFDDRGNSVWEWQLDTGVYTKDVNTQKLRKLDLDELSIADTSIQKRPAGLQPPAPGGGFNPYDRAIREEGGVNPYDKARAIASPLAPKPEEKPVRRTPADMRKLDEWIKQQKKTEKPPGG